MARAATVIAEIYETIDQCRVCRGHRLRPIVSFGSTALADRLVASSQIGLPDPLVPLDLLFCEDCSLVQIAQTVRPEILFNDQYPYYSSVSPALRAHTQSHAESLIAQRGLGPDHLVLEPASNDGYMLRHFKARGIRVLGIDPSQGPTRAARAVGIETLDAFFTEALARGLCEQGCKADLIVANNVLAHVADLHGFVEGLNILLASEGLIAIEVPYIADLIEHCEFDTIYHQHLCYFSVTSLSRLFSAHQLTITRVSKVPIHGGSLRVYVERDRQPGPTAAALMSEEARTGLAAFDGYQKFAARTAAIRNDLVTELRRLRTEGHRLAAYGAAAKGTTLLSYCGLDTRLLDYVVDLNPRKHGLFMPGSRLPIKPVEMLLRDRPDYVLLLAWNFADEIIKQQERFRAAGGRFVIPLPQLSIV